MNSLHTVWDVCIIEKKLGTDPQAVARDLLESITASDIAAWVAVPVEGWALECVTAIGEELARPTDKRRLGVLKATGAALRAAIENTRNVYAGYQILKTAVKAGTGFELP